MNESYERTLTVLKVAHEVILRDGWIQDELGRDDGPKCLIGAIAYASSGTVAGSIDCLAISAVQQLVQDHSIPVWNDRSERTVEDVLFALEATEALIRQWDRELTERQARLQHALYEASFNELARELVDA